MYDISCLRWKFNCTEDVFLLHKEVNAQRSFICKHCGIYNLQMCGSGFRTIDSYPRVLKCPVILIYNFLKLLFLCFQTYIYYLYDSCTLLWCTLLTLYATQTFSSNCLFDRCNLYKIVQKYNSCSFDGL